jgi:hypothetical protein
MTEEHDMFDYTLALEMGRTVDELRRTVPNNEYQAWRAYYQWRAAQIELAAKEAKGG